MASNLVHWLALTSWQASILILLVGMVLWVFRNKIPARWRYGIWLLVAMRLLLPVAPVSSFSIFNYLRLSDVNNLSATLFTPKLLDTGSANKLDDRAQIPEYQGQKKDEGKHLPDSQALNTDGPAVTLPQVILGIWICGMLFCGYRVLRQDLLFAQRLRRTWMVRDPQLLGLLEECRSKLNIGFPIPLLETREVDAPALYGALHPRLLVPEGILESFRVQELRHIFMHELAHVKRVDLVTHWVLTIIQVVHWFNPLVWLAMRRAATDRELACDALALSYTKDEEERESYGHTLIKLLERFVQPAPMLGGVGMLEKGGAMKERITMIAEFQPPNNWPAFGISFLLLLTLFGFTDGQKPAAEIANLVARWPADGKFQATTGASHGFGRGLMGFSMGKFGGAFDLHGGNQFVEVPSSDLLNFRGSFSISVWINPRKDQQGVIVSKWGSTPAFYNNRSYILHTIPGLGLKFCVADLKNQWNPFFHAFETKHEVLKLNTWNYVVASYDKPAGSRKIYVNGLLVAERIDMPVEIIQSDVPFGIGASPITRDGKTVIDYFDGMIDEVRLYSRALSTEEIMILYKAGQERVD